MSFGGFNSTSGFGSSAPAFGFGGGSLSPGFGGANSSPGFGGGGLFGSSQPSGFGAASSGTSIFGGGSGFGGTGGGVFGSGSSSPFGNATNSTSMFGGASSSGVFGSSSPFGGNSSFGNPSSAPFGGGSTFGGGGFGAGQQTINGTMQVPFSAPQENESGAQGRNAIVSYQNISTMKQYLNFSVEELREQDYKAGNKGGQGGGGTFGSMGNTSVFGASSGIGGFGASSSAFGGGMGGTSTFGQSSGSLFGGGGGFGATSGGPFGQSSTPSAFGASSPAFGATGGTGLFGGGNTSGFGASSGFGGFGAASSTGTGLFGGMSTGGFGAASSASSLFGGAGAGQTSNMFNSGTGFGAQSSTSGFGTSAFGSTFGAASSGGFGIGQSSGTSLFGASTGSIFGTGTANAYGTGASSGGLFGGATTTPSMFGGGASTNLFGASSGAGLLGANSGLGQTTSLFGNTTQPAQGLTNNTSGVQPQNNWGGQNAFATGMPQNPQNFSELFGRIAPDLPQNGANGSHVKVGLRQVALPMRKRFNRQMVHSTWVRRNPLERKKQAFNLAMNPSRSTWWTSSRTDSVFVVRSSGGEGSDNAEGNPSDGGILSYSKPKDTNYIPKLIDKLLASSEDQTKYPDDEAIPGSGINGGERMLTQKEIEERLPKITEDDYYIKPNIQGLTNMLRGDPNALKEVHGLVIGRKGFGRIRCEMPIKLEGLDICQCLSFVRGGVKLLNMGDDKPNPLNGPTEVTLEEMYMLDKDKEPRKDEAAMKKMRAHTMKYCKSEGAQFISYEEGVWRFKVDWLA